MMLVLKFFKITFTAKFLFFISFNCLMYSIYEKHLISKLYKKVAFKI